MRQPSDFITWLNDAYAMELSLAEVLGRHARPVGVCRQTLADETRMAAWQQDHHPGPDQELWGQKCSPAG